MERFRIARLLRKTRKEMGLTASEVANRLMWNRHMVYSCENGWTVSAERVIEYAKLLGLETKGMKGRWNSI